MDKKVSKKLNKKEQSNYYNDKLLYYMKHMKEIEHQKRIDEYMQDMIETADYLSKATYAGKKLVENGYQIFDLRQANEDFRCVLELDNISEINAIFYTTKFDKNGYPEKTEHTQKITKNNFWNAFYEPIWNNLSVSERVRSLEWLFETTNEQRKLDIKEISYFPPSIEDAKNLGTYYYEDNSLYLNLNKIENKNSYFEFPMTLCHELMHARQWKYQKTHKQGEMADIYTAFQTELSHNDYGKISTKFGIDYATEFGLYRTSLSEKVAELQSLKQIKKFKDLNEKEFGKSKSIDRHFEYLKEKMLFQKTSKYFAGKREHFETTYGIMTNEEVVLNGQSENLHKLLLLWNLKNIQLSNLYKDKRKEKSLFDEKTNQYHLKKLNKAKFNELKNIASQKLKELNVLINTKKAELEKIKEVFLSTLSNGKLPDDFDTKTEFKELKILDEKQSNYSLPRWLHSDEDKFKEKLKRSKVRSERMKKQHQEIKAKNQEENVDNKVE